MRTRGAGSARLETVAVSNERRAPETLQPVGVRPTLGRENFPGNLEMGRRRDARQFGHEFADVELKLEALSRTRHARRSLIS